MLFLTFSAETLVKSEWADLINRLVIFDRENFPFPWAHEDWISFFESHRDARLNLFCGELDDKEILAVSLWDVNIVDSFGHLLKIMVARNHRQKGLGLKCLEASLIELKQQGIVDFYLEVEENNTAAQKLYIRCGFQSVHVKKNFYSNGESARIMILKA